jgi:hypothetical protein
MDAHPARRHTKTLFSRAARRRRRQGASASKSSQPSSFGRRSQAEVEIGSAICKQHVARTGVTSIECFFFADMIKGSLAPANTPALRHLGAFNE